MAKHVLLVFSDPTEGKEDEYNRWYDDVHLGEVLAVEGFVSAQRFKVSDVAPGLTEHKYLAIYNLETDDPGQVMKSLGEALPSMNISDAFNAATAKTCMAGEVSKLIEAG